MPTKQELRNFTTSRRYLDVPLYTGQVWTIQSITREEQRQWHKATQKKDGTEDPKKTPFSNDVLLSMTIVDDKKQLAFTVGDALGGMFSEWDTGITNPLYLAALKHCRLIENKEVDDSTKNSDETPESNSSGVSHIDKD